MALLNSILWNGKSIRDFGAEIIDVKGRGQPEIKRKSLGISGRHGELTFGAKYLPRRIDLNGYVEGASHTTLLGYIDDLKNLFSMRDSIEALGNEQLSDTNLVGKLEFGDETDRHFRAQYDGIFGLRDISARWMKNDFIRFGMRFLCTDPFAYANVLTEVTMTPTADAFKVYDTGTHFSESDIDIHGAVTNPVIVSGDKVGVAHFDNDDDLRDVENVNVAGNFAAAFGYRTRKTLTSQQSKAIQIVNKDNLYYDRGAVVNNQNYRNFNPYQGTMIFWVKPYFDGDDGLEHVVFRISDAINNGISVIKLSTNTLRLQINSAGTVVTVNSVALNSSNFGAGSWFQIVARWDINNGISGTSNTAELEINAGTPVTSTDAHGTPSDTDQFFAIGQGYSTTPDGSTSIFDGLIHWQIFERALTDAEVTALYNSGAGVEPFVTPDTKLLSAGELSSGDPVSVQYPWVDNKFTDGDQEVDPSSEWIYGGASGTGPNTSVTNEATIVKYDLQSAQLDWDAAASGERVHLNSNVLVNSQDYFYRLWVFVETLNASDELELFIVGSATVLSRRLDTGTDDMGVSYTTGTWLYFEGTFEADTSVVHQFRFRKLNANGDATIYIDQMDCQVNKVDNAGFEGTYVAGIAPNWQSTGTATMTEENVIIHSGSASQKIVVTAGNQGGVRTDPAGGITLIANTWYIFPVWARGASGGEVLQISVANFDDITFNQNFTLTSSWAKYTLMIKTASDTTGTIVFQGVDAGTIYIDDGSIIELDTITANAASKATPEAISYSPAKYGQGLKIDGSDVLSWNIVGNPNEGSVSVWFRPQFAADWDDDTDDPSIFIHENGSSNFISLTYDWTSDKWIFIKRHGGTIEQAEVTGQTFTKDQRLHFVGTYGAGGVKGYIDGIIGSLVDSNTDALVLTPANLRMSNRTATIFPDSIIDELYIYSRELSQQEVTALFNNPRATKLDNRVFGITRTFAVNDKAIIRTLPETLEFADESGDTIANDISSMNSGSQFPRLTANKAVVYNKVAADSININYRKRWL